MFSRATKSVVKSLGSRQIHIDEKNFKPSWIMTVKKACSTKVSQPNTINNARTDNNIVHNLSNLQEDNGKTQTDQLVEALYRLPIAEEASTLNNSLICNEIISKAANVCSRMHPYARIISEMDPSSKAWQRDCTIAAICKWFPDLIYLSFQEYDISIISELKNVKSLNQSIKRKKGNKNLFCVAKKNYFLSNSKKSTSELMEECGNAKIFSNIEPCCRTIRKSINWITNWVESKLLNEISDHGRRCISWFLIKAFAVKNTSINLMNDYFSKQRNIIGNKSKTYFFPNYKCKNNDIAVTLNRNSKAVTGDTLNTVEEENWIQRTSCKIKSMLPDLHSKIRSRSTTVLNLYCLENIFAANESIPISEVISNRIFLASKECDSRSSIRRNIEKFCMQRKKSLRKKIDRDDICKKRKRFCKTAEKKCQKRERTCEKKEVHCSKKRKQTCKEQGKVSCKRRKDLPDKEDTRDCRKTREIKFQEESSKRYKDCDTSKTKKDFCQKQRCVEQKQISCSKSAPTKQIEKDICIKSEKEYQKSYDESDKCTKEKKVRKGEDEKASYEQRQMKKTCEEKKKKDCEEEEKSEKSKCSEIKKIDLCKKKECPPVTKAPGCSEEKNE